MVRAHTLLCGGCRCERVLSIDLGFNKTGLPVSKNSETAFLRLRLRRIYLSVFFIYRISLSQHLCTKLDP